MVDTGGKRPCRPGPAVLGDPSRWASQSACLASTKRSIEALVEGKVMRPVDAEATAHLVNGACLNASLWIASADDPHAASAPCLPSPKMAIT